MRAIFDGHNDALTKAAPAALAQGRQTGHLDLPRMREGGLRGGIFAVFTPSPGARTPRARRAPEPAAAPSQAQASAHATGAAGRLLGLERAGEVRVGRTIADVDGARDRDGPPVAVLHLEGAEAIDPGLESLPLWHEAGLRSLGPVWSRSNDFGHGVPFVAPSSPDTGPGLTGRGRALVEGCAELGILVDLSHLNEAGFWDVAALEAGPLVASHSCAHRLCESSRNLTDAQLDAIGASGGLVGITFACPFLRADFANDADTPLDLIVTHARYVAERIGTDHLALGSDFDGATIPAQIGDAAGMPKLLDAFARAGFADGEIDAIAWENWRRVLGAWWST